MTLLKIAKSLENVDSEAFDTICNKYQIDFDEQLPQKTPVSPFMKKRIEWSLLERSNAKVGTGLAEKFCQ